MNDNMSDLLTEERNKVKELTVENKKLKEQLNLANESNASDLSDAFWEEFCEKCGNDEDFVVELIKNKAVKMTDTDKRGLTPLLCAAMEGSYKLTQLCLNMGADTHHKDNKGRTAIDLARQFAYFHTAQLLMFHEMKGNVGGRVRETAHILKKQNGIVENIVRFLAAYDAPQRKAFETTTIDMTSSFIADKVCFSEDLLILCWSFIVRDAQKSNPMESKLWKAIKKSCIEVIHSGSQCDWFWFKKFILPSMIWYNECSTEKVKIDDEKKENEELKGSYLYFELLAWVECEAKEQLFALEKKLAVAAKTDPKSWAALTTWTMKMKGKESKSSAARNDSVPNGIVAQHTFSELIHSGTSAAFKAHEFYDHSQYLSQLILLAHSVDDEFHRSIQSIFQIDRKTSTGRFTDILSLPSDERKEEKCGDIGHSVQYMRGPVKQMARAKSKAENDYSAETYPTTAPVLDLNRCSLIFEDIPSLLAALSLFTSKVRYFQSGNIIAVVRSKNGFVEYLKDPQYSDIKLNVLIVGTKHNIVGEVQFLLRTMLNFKNKAHNLYAVQRQEDFMRNALSNVLPVLMDLEKQLFVAGNMGDVTALMSLVIFSNQTEEFLMTVDEGTKESIVHNICYAGLSKAFKFLKGFVSEELFANRLCSQNQYGSTGVVYARRHKQMFEAILSMKSVKENFSKKSANYSVFEMMKNVSDPAVFEKIIMKLGISQERLTAIVKTVPMDKIERTLLGIMAACGKLDVIKFIESQMEHIAFVESILVAHELGNNAFAFAAANEQFAVLKYLLAPKFKALKEKYESDNKLFFKTLTAMAELNASPEMYEFILTEAFAVSKKRMADIANFSDNPLLRTVTVAYCSPLAVAKVIATKMTADDFANAILMRDRNGKSAIDYAQSLKKPKMLKFFRNIKMEKSDENDNDDDDE